MKEKIARIIAIIVITCTIIILAILTYYTKAEIESKIPKEVQNTCDVTVEKFMNRNIFIIKPKEAEKTDTTILYFHGGAYVAETSKKHWKFLANIVKDTGATVILPDYPLAPKYTYKDVFEMAEPLYKEILQKTNIENLIVMGDSAGGGIALALEEKLSKDNVLMPSKTILISPWLDVRLNNPQIDEVQKNDKQLNKDKLKLAGIEYASDDGINSYLVNPIDGDLSKLQNIIIFTGTNDILNPDVHVLKERASKVETNIEVKEYEEASHIWMIEETSKKELVEKGYQDILIHIERETNEK